jgi:hypothetical protein
MFILALQQFGASGSEAGLLLGFLGLPGARIMEKHGFHDIEMELSKKIKFVTALEMQKALDEEVRLQFNVDETPHLNQLWLKMTQILVFLLLI